MAARLIATLGWKYEPKWLIDQLKENMGGWVDDFAILDCRNRDELWIHEGEYRLAMRKMAIEMGATWILITSADERWEDRAGEVIRPLIDNVPMLPNGDISTKVIYEFNLRELFAEKQYRVDPPWLKVRRRLYPILADQNFAYQPIQCPSMPQNQDYEIQHVDVNIYHLKMIEKENRVTRTRVFKKLDPTNQFQGIGYDYLNNDAGMKLEWITPDRMYSPPYRKYLFKVPEKYL